MTPRLEFHFDFGSPNAYLAHLVIPAIEARTGATFSYVPILLGGVFKATNNVSPAVSLKGIANKPEYYALETRRFLKKHAITAYTRNPHFPVNTLQLMRGAVFAQSQDYFAQYVDAVYHHMWVEPKKMDEAEVMREALALVRPARRGHHGRRTAAGDQTAAAQEYRGCGGPRRVWRAELFCRGRTLFRQG